MVNMLGFAIYMNSVATTQLCSAVLKAAVDNMSMSGCDRVPIKLYIHIQKSEVYIICMSQSILLLIFSTIQKYKHHSWFTNPLETDDSRI